MAKKMSGLGRGFDALLPTNFDSSILAAEGEKILQVAVVRIEPNPHQPRRDFDEEALAELAASLKQYGIIQPLVVTPALNGTHQLIAGERRWRAARLAGLTEVPVIVRTAKDQERLELALIENVQRVDLSPLEQAASIEGLHQQFNLPYDAIARRLGKAMSTVTNIVRLLHLPVDAAEALRQRKITEGHARAILSIKDFPDQQAELLKASSTMVGRFAKPSVMSSASKPGIPLRKPLALELLPKPPKPNACPNGWQPRCRLSVWPRAVNWKLALPTTTT